MKVAADETLNRQGRYMGCWVHILLHSQARFQQLECRLKGFSGPVGSGKSAALCFESVRRAYVNRGRQGMLAAPTFAMLREASLVGMVRMLEDQEIEYDYKRGD